MYNSNFLENTCTKTNCVNIYFLECDKTDEVNPWSAELIIHRR